MTNFFDIMHKKYGEMLYKQHEDFLRYTLCILT